MKHNKQQALSQLIRLTDTLRRIDCGLETKNPLVIQRAIIRYKNLIIKLRSN